MSQRLLPAVRWRMVPFINDDQVKKVRLHAIRQGGLALAMDLLNIRVNEMALLKAAYQRLRVVFAGGGEIISIEDHVVIDPEIVFQQVLGLSYALLCHEVGCNDEHSTFREPKRDYRDQPSLACSCR
ncbi:hypothetical protein D3C84_379960 [compost metagenome]